MTYLEFLILFLLIPIGLLALFQPKPIARLGSRATAPWIALLTLIALIYTTPWDNYLVYRGVWYYGADRVMGTIGYVPIEEYIFFILQPILTSLVLCWLLYSREDVEESPPPFIRTGYTLFWLFLAVLGAVLTMGERSLYLGLILAWASPVLAGMAWLSSHRFWSFKKQWLLGISIPTVYLWIADHVAIGAGIWDISNTYSLDVDPLGLPIEEAVFFFVTNVLVVQGLLMFLPLDQYSDRLQ